jgi:hypothetical protein
VATPPSETAVPTTSENTRYARLAAATRKQATEGGALYNLATSATSMRGQELGGVAQAGGGLLTILADTASAVISELVSQSTELITTTRSWADQDLTGHSWLLDALWAYFTGKAGRRRDTHPRPPHRGPDRHPRRNHHPRPTREHHVARGHRRQDPARDRRSHPDCPPDPPGLRR